jgi:glycosyltransferase involved in cell wall biosynthesis
VTPAVTVLIPVFNRERFVDDAIRSVLEQDFTDFELLLVDDGSTDRTPAVLEAWRQRDARIVVVTSPTNQGIPDALNLGVAHARGRYVARLDSDDLMRPYRLARQAAVLEARPDVALVSSAYDIVDVDGRHLATWTGEPPEVTAFLLNFFNVVGGGGQVMFRLADVRDEGGFSRDYPSTEDYELWVRLARRGRIETLSLVGMTKRTHPDQSLKRYAGVKRAHWTAIMRAALEPYLRRPVRDDEITALLALWRHEDGPGTSRIADDVMREALTRFRLDTPDPALQQRARRRISRQWYVAARMLLSRGHAFESLACVAHAARWRIARR